MYFHLADITVRAGDSVRQGQTIGHVGSTGRSTGPHLHWGVKVHSENIDPESLLDIFAETSR